MRWKDYAATLSEAEHRRVLIALGAGLQSARVASSMVTHDGDLADIRRNVAVAVSQLEDVLRLLPEA